MRLGQRGIGRRALGLSFVVLREGLQLEQAQEATCRSASPHLIIRSASE